MTSITHSPVRPGRRLSAAVAARRRADRGRRRRHDHELQRADVLLRRRAVHEHRRRLERLRRDRRRNGADIVFTPQTFPNAARPNNVVAPSGPTSIPAAGGGIRVAVLTRRAATDWIVVDWAGVKNFSNATTHSFEIWIQLVRQPAPARRARHVLDARLGDGDRNGARRSGLRLELGRREPRRHERAEHLRPRRRTAAEFASITSPAGAGGTATITYDASAKKAGHVQVGRRHDVERHAGHDAGGADAHRDEAVARDRNRTRGRLRAAPRVI